MIESKQNFEKFHRVFLKIIVDERNLKIQPKIGDTKELAQFYENVNL